ncbi:hypothetical protein NS212_14115 [Pseudomonas parafulva]|nr:hypothetical protein NS212_14115 [Pseudomonas parafulva]
MQFKRTRLLIVVLSFALLILALLGLPRAIFLVEGRDTPRYTQNEGLEVKERARKAESLQEFKRSGPFTSTGRAAVRKLQADAVIIPASLSSSSGVFA